MTDVFPPASSPACSVNCPANSSLGFPPRTTSKLNRYASSRSRSALRCWIDIVPCFPVSLKSFCRNASSSLICVFSLCSSSACFDSETCAPRGMLRSLSSSLAFAFKRAFSSRNRAPSLSSRCCFSATSLRLKPPRNWPRSKPHHHMPATSATRAPRAGSFQRHDSWVRTDIRGALMPKVCRSLRPRTRRFMFSTRGCDSLRWSLGSREHRGRGEAGGLGESEHQVHVLHCLAGRAFDEVVDDAKHDRDIAVVRPVDRDAARVGRSNRTRFRMASGGHTVDER